MPIIIPTTLLDVPALQEQYPNFQSVDNCAREKIQPEMEVLLRSNQEDFYVKVEEVHETYLVGKVLTETFYFEQPFGFYDLIQFERKNVIDIKVIYGVYY